MAYLDNVFEAMGRIGRTAYQIDTSQASQPTTFNEVAALAYINPAWLANLSAQYDAQLRTETTPMGVWASAAANILIGLTYAQDPFYGTSITNALSYVLVQMAAAGSTVKACTIGQSTVADAANVGSGAVFVTTTRGDGLIFQNTIAEASTLLITSDSYTGGATVGQEPWQWSGAQNTSSLGTGTGVGLWDWDWPQGSGAGASGQCVSTLQDAATVTGNYLTNGAFTSWTGSAPAVLDDWYLAVGTWGTSIAREAVTILGGTTYSVKFVVGATLNELTQQFNSSTSNGTVATAGTTAALQAFTGYAFNLWLKGGGVISGGVMTVSLVDGSGTVINDQAGTANSATITLSTVTTSWVAHSFAFRLPVILPAIIRLKVKITTALAGSALYVAGAAWGLPVSLYPGGPNLCLFSNPAAPFEANPDPDGWTITFANNRGGASYGATFQTLFSRLFQTPGLILPYSGSPTYADSLITNA